MRSSSVWSEESYKTWREARNLLKVLSAVRCDEGFDVIVKKLMVQVGTIADISCRLSQLDWYAWDPRAVSLVRATREKVRAALRLLEESGNVLDDDLASRLRELMDDASDSMVKAFRKARSASMKYKPMLYALSAILLAPAYYVALELAQALSATMQLSLTLLIAAAVGGILALFKQPTLAPTIVAAGYLCFNALVFRLIGVDLRLAITLLEVGAVCSCLLTAGLYSKLSGLLEQGLHIVATSLRQEGTDRGPQSYGKEVDGNIILSELIRIYVSKYGEKGAEILEYELKMMQHQGLTRREALLQRAKDLGILKAEH